MSFNNFKPEIWSKELLIELDQKFVYVDICNRDYEGEIANYGDTVKINALGEISVFTYTSNTDLPDPETLTAEQTILKIDKQDAFNFQIDDVDDRQSKPKVMSEAMRKAAIKLAKKADTNVAGTYVDFDHDLGNLTITNPADAYEVLVDISTKMDEADVPEDGRVVVINPAFRGLLRKDPRFTDLSASGQAVLQNGRIGFVAGLEVRVSNNLPVVGDYFYISAVYEGTISFANQILKMVPYSMEKRFSDALKGLHVYGFKVVRPDTGVYAGIKIDLA